MIRLIAAIDSKQGIAKNGHIPWRLPTDIKYYREQTTKYGAFMLMGRKTFEEYTHIPTDRKILVLTTNFDYKAPDGVGVVNDLEKFLSEWRDDLWVIGGQKLFEDTIDKSDELYLTRIEADFECDRFFPEFESKFTLKSRSEKQSENGLNFYFEIWTRKP